MANCFSVVFSTLSQLYNFSLPGIGIAFGAVIVGVFGVPLLVKAYKHLF